MGVGGEDNPYASFLPVAESAAGAKSLNPGDAWEWERERNLASLLTSAQRLRVAACDRQRAVEAFLDKFDLGEDEARYSIGTTSRASWRESTQKKKAGEGEEGDAAAARGSMDDANAFLDALERLVVIRNDLTKAFGGGGSKEGFLRLN